MAQSKKQIQFPAATKNPIKQRSYMGVLGVFILVALLLTIGKVADMVAPKIGSSSGEVMSMADKLVSVGAGVLFLLLGVAFAAVPVINLIFLACGVLTIALPFKDKLGL